MANVPSRTPRRRRATVPSIQELGLDHANQSRAVQRWADQVASPKVNQTSEAPTVSRAIDASAATPAREAVTRGMSDATRQALELARAGDDSLLLPYQPTPSINPPRPRTLAAGYDRDTQTLRVRFRDGTAWAYYDVPPQVWRNFTRVQSPGRFINRTLNNYPYARDDF